MVGDAKASVIDNGIDLSMFRPTNGVRRTTEAFTVGTIAGAAEWKGYRVFLDAIRQIPDQEKRKMRVLVASQFLTEIPGGVSAQLIKPSGESELVAFYHSCDTFICSSFIEGFGLPALEAMACGVPVVITACGGVSEYANRSNCLIVTPGDSTTIAESIVRLSHDWNLRAALRERALETSKSFSIERMTEKYHRFLSEI
jgi:glycosyltransferase involved in cell wall biosynthesis